MAGAHEVFVAWNSGALAEGREALQSAIACSPALPEPIMLMGMQVLLEDGYARTAGVVEEVKRHVATAVALLPDDAHVLLQAVMVLLDAEAIAEATIKLTELRAASGLEDAESAAALNFVVARFARLRGRTDLAETQLKVAIGLDPAEPEYRVQLAEATRCSSHATHRGITCCHRQAPTGRRARRAARGLWRPRMASC